MKPFLEDGLTSIKHPENSLFSEQVTINLYLNGKESYRELAVTYNIPADITIRQWVLKYNGHEKLKASGTGGIAIMTKGRKKLQ